MSTPLMHAIDSRSASALASGDLVPVQSEQIEMDDGGMRFRVLWVASLAAKRCHGPGSDSRWPTSTPTSTPS